MALQMSLGAGTIQELSIDRVVAQTPDDGGERSRGYHKTAILPSTFGPASEPQLTIVIAGNL